jgi:hypothetical protein
MTRPTSVINAPPTAHRNPTKIGMKLPPGETANSFEHERIWFKRVAIADALRDMMHAEHYPFVVTVSIRA